MRFPGRLADSEDIMAFAEGCDTPRKNGLAQQVEDFFDDPYGVCYVEGGDEAVNAEIRSWGAALAIWEMSGIVRTVRKILNRLYGVKDRRSRCASPAPMAGSNGRRWSHSRSRGRPIGISASSRTAARSS